MSPFKFLLQEIVHVQCTSKHRNQFSCMKRDSWSCMTHIKYKLHATDSEEFSALEFCYLKQNSKTAKGPITIKEAKNISMQDIISLTKFAEFGTLLADISCSVTYLYHETLVIVGQHRFFTVNDFISNILSCIFDKIQEIQFGLWSTKFDQIGLIAFFLLLKHGNSIEFQTIQKAKTKKREYSKLLSVLWHSAIQAQAAKAKSYVLTKTDTSNWHCFHWIVCQSTRTHQADRRILLIPKRLI